MNISIHNPHDHFVRNAFTRPAVAIPFFERYLPASISADLDLSSLDLKEGTFVDEELQLQQSDLLFTVGMRDGRRAHLYLLLEHKSQNDVWTPAQLLGYMDRIWTRERQPKGSQPPLTPVIPLVLFHGETGWSAARDFRELVNPTRALAEFTPGFKYILCDLTQEQLDDLQQGAWLALTLQVLKFSRSDELSERLPEIVALINRLHDQWDDALAFLATALRYLAAVAPGLDETTVREALHGVLPISTENTIMATLAEVWTQRGMEQGMEQGMEKGQTLHARQALRKLLISRFGALPDGLEQRIEQADHTTLDAWFEAALTASSLESLFPEERG